MGPTITYLREPPRTADLVIVGGGVVGAATAFFAARAGMHPLIVERRPRLATLTTAAATGGFRLQFDTREEMDLVRESVELFLHFAEVTRQTAYDPGVRPQGYLFLTTDPAAAARQRELVAQQHSWGQKDIEILTGGEVRRRFPYASPDVIQARFRQGDGFIDPKRLTHGLAAASAAPAAVGCSVTGFRLSGGRLAAVETTAGVISTRTAVIAAGPLSALVAHEAGVQLPVTAVRRQKIVLPDLPQVPADAPMTIDEDTGVHWRPALQGAYLLYTDPTTAATHPSDPVGIDHELAFRLLDPASPIAAARVAPFWRDVWEHGAIQWMIQAGRYTMTPDHRPLIGPTGVEGLWVNTGYSGHGVMASPAGSRLLADLLAGRLGAADNPFGLDREMEPRGTGPL